MVLQNILQAMGHTPLVRLNRIVPQGYADVLVKVEGQNVGGSIKTRTAYNMVCDAERRGCLRKGSVIVEPTSGNQGIGLALVCAVKGYRVVIVMPSSVSEERRKLICHYGAEVVLVQDEGNIGKCIAECVRLARDMASRDTNIFVPQQFENRKNPETHREHTAREIVEQCEGKIDGFCAGIGTGGTLTGVGEVLKAHNPNVEIWAVEPENAAILAGGAVTTHVQMGIGDGLVPPVLNTGIFQKVCVISDVEALRTARLLAQKEGIACGISSGTNVAAAIKLAGELGAGKTVVTVLPDTAERYFSTPLFDCE